MRNVIRSLRDEVRVSQNIDQRVRMVARLRGERMVVHVIQNIGEHVRMVAQLRRE